MATEENDQWGRGLTFPNTSVHRLLSITPVAAVPFVRTSKACEANITEKSDTPGGYPTSRVKMFFDDAADGRLWRWLGEAEQLSEGGEWFACSGKRGADYFQMRQTFSADGRLHRSKECRLFPKRAGFLFSCPKSFLRLEVTRQTISSRLELYNTIMSRGVGWQIISNPAPLYRGPTAKRAAFPSPTKSSVSVKKILTPPASPSRLVYPLSHLSCPPPPPAAYLPRPPVRAPPPPCGRSSAAGRVPSSRRVARDGVPPPW